MGKTMRPGSISGLFQTLLGSALPVSEQWADMLEPWQPPVELREPTVKAPDRFESHPVFSDLSVNNLEPWPTYGPAVVQPPATGSRSRDEGPLEDRGGQVPGDGTETATDALPDPVRPGEQYAQAGSAGRPPRRGVGPPETPVGRLLSEVFEGKIRALGELEPNNRLLTRIQAPDFRPAQSDIDKLDLELIMARQRAPGAIDTQASGIGVGPFARESIPARSERRVWTEAERAEINRIGSQYGCHACGTRDPGGAGSNFFMDHQSATRLKRPGEDQIILPHCMSCSVRQGGLISNAVKREEQ
jgi:hypothetical protein